MSDESNKQRKESALLMARTDAAAPDGTWTRVAILGGVAYGALCGTAAENFFSDLKAMDLEELHRTLRDFIEDKRYLILVDDVWTIAVWHAIRTVLPENNKSSRVIVTTRIKRVAEACSPANTWEDSIYPIKPLKSEDSDKLFDNRVFGPNNPCPNHLKAAKSNILEKCGGLPLAIVSIGSLLSGYTSPGSVDMWNRICNSIGSQMESNPTLEAMKQLITLSYNHLPQHLKDCMMYLSIFPEDFAIGKGRLLKRWIAEGLIPEKRGLTPLEVAEEFLGELMSRNMVEPASVNYDGEVKECRVHDMMLEIIVSKSLEENFVSLVGSTWGRASSYDTVRRLSVQGEDPSSFQEEMEMQHVRSLTTFSSRGHRKILNRLPEFTLLRVLDLERCKDLQDQDMKHVCRLFLLRYLNLQGTDITVLPSQIGELVHLQTLWLYNTLLEGVPKSVIKLENLVHLGLENRETWRVLLRLPLGLKKMKSLYELQRLELREDDAELAKEIGELVQLRVLGVYLNCSNCSEKHVLKELASSVCKISSLREFYVQDMTSHSDNMNFLHDLPSPPHLLRHLTIGGKIDRLPDWVGSHENLLYVQFWWIDLHSDEIYGVLCKLPNLLKITLDRKCCKDEELVARSAFKFRALKELAFVPYGNNVPNSRVLRFEEGSMQKVERLTMKFEHFERSLVGVKNLTSLREVKLHGKKENRTLHVALDQLKTESSRRQESDWFKVVITYD